MDLINQFIENYKKKINFYETAGRIAAEMLEDALRSSGIPRHGNLARQEPQPAQNQGDAAE